PLVAIAPPAPTLPPWPRQPGADTGMLESTSVPRRSTRKRGAGRGRFMLARGRKLGYRSVSCTGGLWMPLAWPGPAPVEERTGPKGWCRYRKSGCTEPADRTRSLRLGSGPFLSPCSSTVHRPEKRPHAFMEVVMYAEVPEPAEIPELTDQDIAALPEDRIAALSDTLLEGLLDDLHERAARMTRQAAAAFEPVI